MFARHDGATWAYYLVKISEVEEWTVWTNLQLFLEGIFPVKTHTSKGTWPSSLYLYLWQAPPSITGPTLRSSIKETSLNLFWQLCASFKKGKGLNGGVFLLLLGSVVQGNGESSDFELIALQQKQAGGTDSRKEYYMLSAVLGAFLVYCLSSWPPWKLQDVIIPTEEKQKWNTGLSAHSVSRPARHCSATYPSRTS